MTEEEQQWARWMQAAVAGDRVRYRQLLDALVPLVTAIARSCLLRNGRDLSELDDIVQESFLTIHLKRHLWDPSRPLVPWLRALVANKAIDILRRKGHRTVLPIEDFENVLPAPTPEPTLSTEDIANLIRTLKGRQREVVEAVALGGLTIAEVAKKFGLAEGSARVTLHRGLKTLAEIYRKSGA